ncbi:MAG: PAS domain S-box protein [Paludibacter sp.]
MDGKIKILAIDDNFDNLITIQALVMEAFPAATVAFALSGKEGLELAETLNPDVILLDVIMPEMDGFEVCQKLKSNQLTSEIPVVFVTALKGDRDNRIRGLEVGGDAFLAKPIDETELVAQIRAMVKVKFSNLIRKDENERLTTIVAERTAELETTNTATLNLLEDLQTEIVARRKTEEALSKSEALYRSVLNASPDNITVTDLIGKILMISQNGLKLIGYENENQLIGRYFGEFLVPEDMERAIKNIDAMSKGIFNGSEEYRIVHANGSSVHVEINAEFVLDSFGSPNKIVFAIRDITERVKSQSALRESEEKFREMANLLPQIVFEIDTKGNLTYVNKQTYTLAGYSEDDYLIGMNTLELYIPEDRDRAISNIGARLSGTMEGSNQYTMIRKDGSTFPVLVYSTPIIRNNKPQGLRGIIVDITEQKQAEEKIIENESKYHNLFNLLRSMSDTMPDMLWAKDLDGKFLFANKSICDNLLIAKDTDEPIGKDDFYFVNRQRNEQPDNPDWHTFGELCVDSDGITKQAMQRMQFDEFGNVKGEFLYLDVHKAPLYNDKNKLIGLVGSGRDVTAKKAIENQLEQTRINYETFFNTFDEFLFVLDEEGNIIHTNSTVRERLEYNEDELLGKSVLEVYPADRREEAGRIVGEMLMGIADFCPVPLITKSGVQIPVETRISRGFWDGKPVIFGVTKDITKLVFSEEKFSKLFHLNPSAAGLTDINSGQYIEVNQAFYDLLGFEVNEVIGKTPNEIGILDEKNAILLYSKIDNNSNVSDAEIDLIAKNGDVKNVSISGQIIVVQNQVYRFTVVQDLTEQKKNQQELLQSEEKYRSLVENSPNGIAIHQEGKFVYINNSGLKMFGTTHIEEVIGKSILSIVHPDSLDAVMKRVSQVLSGDMVPLLEEKLIRLDGTFFYAEVIALATTYDGKPAGQVIVNDITDKKLANEQLKESEEKFREMANMLPQIVFESDLSGNLTYINKHAYQLGGFDETTETLIGRSSLDFYIPEDKQKAIDNIRLKLAGKELTNHAYTMVRKDGSTFPILVYSNPIIKNNQHVGLRGIIVDISEQKKAEQNIKHLVRLHAFQSHINQAIVKSKSKNELFQTISEVAIEYGEFRMCWIGLYDIELNKLVPVNVAGYNEGYIETLSILPGDKKTGRGPTGLAFYENRVVFCNDIETDPMMKPWKENALERGYKSSFSTPILSNGKPVGIITLYASEINFFEEDEKNLIENIGRNISYALDVFDSENERKSVEIALKESESKYRNLMDNSPEGITIYVDGKVEYINKEALRLMRATDASELFGKTIVDFIHPDNIELVLERMKMVAMAPINSILPSVEEKYLRLDGTEVFVEIKVMPILFEGKHAIQLAGHDITDRKEAELALEQSRLELQTIYDSAPVMMCVVDDERRIQFANNAFASLSELPAEIIKGGAVGGVVGCINSLDDTRGCGYGPKCGSCTLRIAMQKTFHTGIGQTNVEYQSTLEVGGVSRDVSLLGSTALINKDNSKRLLLCLIDITGRKMTEEALKKSETLLRTFIDNSPFEIWARDINSIGILENKKLTDHYGSIIGHSTTSDNRVGQDIVEFWERNNARAFAGEILDEEFEFIVSGEPRIFQQIEFPIKSNENIIGIAGFNIDITDRKIAEEKIRENNIRLELAMQISNMAWWEMDFETGVVRFGKLKSDMLGFPSEKFNTYIDFMDLVHPDDYQNAMKAMIDHIHGKKEKYEIEYRILTSTGTYKWFYDIGSISKRDINGKPLTVSGLVVDISYRKDAEKELADQKQFFEQMFMQSSLSTQILDNEGWCERINPKLSQLFGVEAHYMEGRVYNIFNDAEILRKGIDSKLKKVFEEAQTTEWEVLFDIGEAADSQNIQLNKRKIAWFSNWAYPILDENHKVSHVIIQHSDITDRKSAEQALSESQEQLKKFAAHLQNVREEERSNLAREIHDDLGQILIAMKIDLGLLKQSILKTLTQEESKKLENNFLELQKLVDNTLKSARRIMTDLRPEVLDLLGFIDTVTQYLKSFQERNKITCNFTNNTSDIQLTSQQSVALYRIVQESLNNISKHAKATVVNIILDQHGDNLSIEITDNGIGFDMSDPKKTDSYGLLGMKERVFLLNGELIINSELTKGTTIKVVMPKN